MPARAASIALVLTCTHSYSPHRMCVVRVCLDLSVHKEKKNFGADTSMHSAFGFERGQQNLKGGAAPRNVALARTLAMVTYKKEHSKLANLSSALYLKLQSLCMGKSQRCTVEELLWLFAPLLRLCASAAYRIDELLVSLISECTFSLGTRP